MPIRDDKIYCISHATQQMSEIPGDNGLVHLVPDGHGGHQMSETHIVPLTIFRCPSCGYVELYTLDRPSR